MEVLGTHRINATYNYFCNIETIYLFVQAKDCQVRAALEVALASKHLAPDDSDLRKLFNQFKGERLGFGIGADVLTGQYLRTATFKSLLNREDLATQAAKRVSDELVALSRAIASGDDEELLEARAKMAFIRIRKWR